MKSLVPNYDIYFLLEPASTQVPQAGPALRALSKPNLPVIGTDVFYREETDSALLGIRLNREKLNSSYYNQIVSVSERTKLPLIDPMRLTVEGRASFFSLQRQHYFPLRTNLDSVSRALETLASQDLRAPTLASGTGSKNLAARTDTGAVTQYREGTEEAWEKPEMLTTCSPRAAAIAKPVEGISAAILRNGLWLPVRLRSLASKKAYVVTSALPRVGDTVYLALSYNSDSVVVEGTSDMVTSVSDAARTGSSGFSVDFSNISDLSRTDLHRFLRTARNSGAIIHPPPSRTSIRLPVMWPAMIFANGQGFSSTALDFSKGGAFLKTKRNITGQIEFEIPMDNSEIRVTGIANVIRQSGGQNQGLGIQFVRFARPLEEKMYRSFLRRVANRIEKQIIINGPTDRCKELSHNLSSIGYSTVVASDSSVFLQSANGATPPDIAVIDPVPSGLVGADWLTQRLAQANVPCVVAGDSMSRIRLKIDSILNVDQGSRSKIST